MLRRDIETKSEERTLERDVANAVRPTSMTLFLYLAEHSLQKRSDPAKLCRGIKDDQIRVTTPTTSIPSVVEEIYNASIRLKHPSAIISSDLLS